MPFIVNTAGGGDDNVDVDTELAAEGASSRGGSKLIALWGITALVGIINGLTSGGECMNAGMLSRGRVRGGRQLWICLVDC